MDARKPPNWRRDAGFFARIEASGALRAIIRRDGAALVVSAGLAREFGGRPPSIFWEAVESPPDSDDSLRLAAAVAAGESCAGGIMLRSEAAQGGALRFEALPLPPDGEEPVVLLCLEPDPAAIVAEAVDAFHALDHALRSPLNVMEGYLQLLLCLGLSEQQSGHVRTAMTAAQTATELLAEHQRRLDAWRARYEDGSDDASAGEPCGNPPPRPPAR